MNDKRVLVLRGGPSNEHENSLRSGAKVLEALSKLYSTQDIVISRQGEWLDRGLVRSADKLLESADMVFIALHGAYGEDGEIQKLLQRYNIPFTGSRSLPSAIAYNKNLSKKILRQHGIITPPERAVSQLDISELEQICHEITAQFGPEYIIKPEEGGSSVGIKFVRAGESLADAISQALAQTEKVIVEEYIRGREMTCGTIENFRNEPIYVLPAIEIILPQTVDYFTTEAKYSGLTKEVCPANLTYSERSAIADITAKVHTVLGLSQFSRSDFILRQGVPYFLEVNTIPGLTADSLYPKSAEAVGLSYEDLMTHLVETATT